MINVLLVPLQTLIKQKVLMQGLGIEEQNKRVLILDNLKVCPFCGSSISIVVCDDEGNIHPDEYEHNPWSGLGYMLYHDINDDPKGRCPIAGHEGEGVLGTFIYDTREEATEAWNVQRKDYYNVSPEDDK